MVRGLVQRPSLLALILALGIVLAPLWLACNGGGPESLEPSPFVPTAGLAVCEKLAEAKRFRYSFEYSIESPKPTGEIDVSAVADADGPFALPPDYPDFAIGQSIEGSFEGPDKYQLVVKTQGQRDLPMVFIGERQWINQAGQWLESQTSGLGVPFPPNLVCLSTLSAMDLTSSTASEEVINGEKARHFREEQVPREVAAGLLGPESDMGRLLKLYTVDAWISDETGLPLRITADSVANYPSGREMKMNLNLELKDFQDKKIKIEPPS